MDEKGLRVEEVALRLGVATRTIDLWYRWKRKNLEHPFAKLLPDYKYQDGVRVWQNSDVDNLIIFKESKPNGRGGILGQVTYRKKEK